MPNLVPAQYRYVAVSTVDVPLTADALAAHFTGKDAYRHTRYIVVRDRAAQATALLRVDKQSGAPLFSPITGVEMLARPDECAFAVDLEADTGVPTALAAVARRRAPGARAVVVEGRYHHVNFILDPAPIRVRVADVVPPHPAKLVDQARRVLDLAEDLPPIELVPEIVDLVDVARAHPAPRYLLPCRGSGFALDGAELAFLDERPPRQDWALLGCDRSREIHQWFYGNVAPGADICPRRLFPPGDGPLLTKCCLLENQNFLDGVTAIVPWGASLELVREALAGLAAAADPAWAPA